MARWRLINAHYINVPGTEWEQKETDRTTGKQARKVYKVPMLLEPKDAADHNYPGEIVISDGNHPGPRDIIFVGPPTPDMEPMDADAQRITDLHKKDWVHPIESLGGKTYGEAMLEDLQKQIAVLAAAATVKPAGPVSAASIDPKAFAELQAQVKQLMTQNIELSKKLAAKAA